MFLCFCIFVFFFLWFWGHTLLVDLVLELGSEFMWCLLCGTGFMKFGWIIAVCGRFKIFWLLAGRSWWFWVSAASFIVAFGFTGLKLTLWVLVVGFKVELVAVMMVIYRQQNIEGRCKKWYKCLCRDAELCSSDSHSRNYVQLHSQLSSYLCWSFKISVNLFKLGNSLSLIASFPPLSDGYLLGFGELSRQWL